MTAWWPALMEPAEPANRPAKAAEPLHSPGQRLSRSGQILLGVGVSLVAVLLYGVTLEWGLTSNQQFQFCQPLSLWGAPPAEGARQTRALIEALKGATATQKVRLRQQVLILQTESERLCELVIRSRAQEEALLVVATTSLCLLSVTILQGLAEGLVNNTNRTLKAVQISTTVVLVTSAAFLHLGQEVRNTGRLLQLYLWHRDLHQQLVSALANQDRPVFLLQGAAKPTKNMGKGMGLAPPLTDTVQVALLIRAVDTQLQSLPPLSVNLDESAVKKMFGWMSRGLDDDS